MQIAAKRRTYRLSDLHIKAHLRADFTVEKVPQRKQTLCADEIATFQRPAFPFTAAKMNGRPQASIEYANRNFAKQANMLP